MPVNEEAVTAFEDAWSAGGQPRPEDFAPPGDADTLRALAEADLERRLRAGLSARAGDYLRLDAVRGDGAFVLELMRAEFRLRRAGREPDLTTDRFLAQYPEWAAELAGTLPAPPAALVGPDPTPPTPAPVVPGLPRVEGYRLERDLGGNMGRVYLAREAALGRAVALKVLAAGALATPERRRRFATEVQALARLRHPNIVPVYAHGEAGGAPFFTMEYAPGGTLADATGNRPQPARPAAETAAALARAVAHAHAAGVLHRDLKPANVLMTADGTPKVADFGLAKLLDADSGPTETGDALGTPAYMAPEQAAGQTRDIDARTDVYSLGAVLYWLLTGRPPFEGGSSDETRRLVLTADPVPPARLRPGLPRDLETICLKCLARERERRYPSADDLVDDLERFARGEPVRARRPGPAERAARWARRRPAWAASTALAVAAGAALAALGLQVRAAREREAEQQAAAAARLDQARGGLSLLRDIFRDLRPTGERADHPLPDLLAERLGSRVLAIPDGTDDALAEETREALGEAYLSLGFPAKAVEQFRACVDSRAQRLGPDAADALAVRVRLGGALQGAGDPDRAVAEYRDVYERCAKTLGPDHHLTGEARIGVGMAEMARGNLGAGLREAAEGLPGFQVVPETEAAARQMAEILAKSAAGTLRFDDPAIERTLLEGIRLTEQVGPAAAAARVDVELFLAGIYRLTGRAGKSIQIFDKSIAALEKAAVPSRAKIAAARQQLGLALLSEGQLSRGLSMLDLDLQTADRAKFQLVANLATTLALGGQREAAAAVYEAVLPRLRQVLGGADDLTLDTVRAAASAFAQPGAAKGFLKTIDAALTDAEAAGRGDAAIAIRLRDARAGLLEIEGDLRAALPVREAVSRAIDRLAGPDSSDALIERIKWASVLRYAGETKAAADRAAEVLAGWEAAPPLGRLTLNDQLCAAADCLLADGRADRVAGAMAEYVPLVARHGGPRAPALFDLKFWFGAARLAQGRPADALARLEEAADIGGLAARQLWQYQRLRSLTGEALAALGRLDEAERELTEGYQGLKATRLSMPVPLQNHYLREAADRLSRFWGKRGDAAKAAEWGRVRDGHPKPG